MYSPSAITVEPTDSQFWAAQFPNLEMSCAKVALFCPSIGFTIKGLKEVCSYRIHLSFKKSDGLRMTFDKKQNEWKEAKDSRTAVIGDTQEAPKVVVHTDGEKQGFQWMVHDVIFNDIHVTTFKKEQACDEKTFALQTMYRYIPVVTIFNVDDGTTTDVPVEAASFIPVSGYQNSATGKWKAEKNKFATRKNGGVGTKQRKARTKKDTVEPATEQTPKSSSSSPGLLPGVSSPSTQGASLATPSLHFDPAFSQQQFQQFHQFQHYQHFQKIEQYQSFHQFQSFPSHPSHLTYPYYPHYPYYF